MSELQMIYENGEEVTYVYPADPELKTVHDKAFQALSRLILSSGYTSSDGALTETTTVERMMCSLHNWLSKFPSIDAMKNSDYQVLKRLLKGGLVEILAQIIIDFTSFDVGASSDYMAVRYLPLNSLARRMLTNIDSSRKTRLVAWELGTCRRTSPLTPYAR